MIGSRQTLSFWQPKKQMLKLARAVRDLNRGARPALPAEALAVARSRSRLAAEGEKKRRFSEF